MTNNTDKFSGKAEGYARYRPAYPEAYLEDLIQKACVNSRSIIADIGAGTGILTRQLLEHGLKVIAVEPNEDMRRVLEQSIGGQPALTILSGSAEQTGIPDHSVDLVTVAQAFHWFDPIDFRKECKRILRPGGMVSLVWNNRDDSSLQRETSEIFHSLCPAFIGFSGGTAGNPDPMESFFENRLFDKQTFPNEQRSNREDFIGGNLSASYAPRPGDPSYEPFVEAMNRLFEKYQQGGFIISPLTTTSYLGKVSS